jgi:hypothetical protein
MKDSGIIQLYDQCHSKPYGSMWNCSGNIMKDTGECRNNTIAQQKTNIRLKNQRQDR